jgi:plasmid segregation protein ParM
MEKSFVIPSVFEENSINFHKVADNFLDAIKIIDFNGRDYLVGQLALREGSAPHKLINSSVDETDYRLLTNAGLVLATMGRYNRLIVTSGFPFSTYQSYRKKAVEYMQKNYEVAFDTKTYGGDKIMKSAFTVSHADIMLELEGCVRAIRDGENREKNNFFIASIGYGTFEIAKSQPGGLVHRTTDSNKGLQYAISMVENEIRKEYYLNMITEKQFERSFQRGMIVLDRKKINLDELRRESLRSYYYEVISPAMKRKFTNEDFTNTNRIYLVGGGALYPDLVELFKEEYNGILDVILYPEPLLCAAKGYCLQSMSRAKSYSDIESTDNTAYVGLDIGNSNTVVYVYTPDNTDTSEAEKDINHEDSGD